MKKLTKDLPFFKRVLARLIHKLQCVAIKKPITMSLYYYLTKVHFELHYGETLNYYMVHKNQSLNGDTMGDKYFNMALRRHLRISKKVLGLNDQQIKLFGKALYNAFEDGINGIYK